MQPLMVRSANLPLIRTMWLFTAAAAVALYAMPLPLIVGAAINLCANLMAVALILSPSPLNRLHGGMRLLLQLLLVVIAMALLLRNGLPPNLLSDYLSRPGW